jgi:type IV pilus assembly protein PilC
MPNYAYVALDARGHETRGALVVDNQSEALRRLKEMGFFPTKVFQSAYRAAPTRPNQAATAGRHAGLLRLQINIPGLRGRIKTKALIVFTRQVATLLEAGMPLLRGLRLIREQETQGELHRVIGEVSEAIEGGASFSEALAQHPRAFNRLYIQMVKAGEISGAVDVTLARLAGFMEKAQRIKNKVVAAMFYPTAVLTVAAAVLGVLVVFIVPKFEEVFQGLMNGRPMPAFTRHVLDASLFVKSHILIVAGFLVGALLGLRFACSLPPGRRVLDGLKLKAPIVGNVIHKAIVARFARTLGTLAGNGVPLLQALNIVRETTGNLVVSRAVADVHTSVEAGETIAAPLKASGVFPAVMVGMVDVGEQTGALPDMLLKVADTYEDEVDNAVAAMTSLLEPVMIIILAVIVGTIVIALFLPVTDIAVNGFDAPKLDGE